MACREVAHARYGVPDFAHHPYQPIAPGGEDWAGFVVRAAVAMERITRAYAGQTVVIVCHGGIIHVALERTLGLPTTAPLPARFATENTLISSWRSDESASCCAWQLECYNDALHLLGIERKEQAGGERPVALRAGHAHSCE